MQLWDRYDDNKLKGKTEKTTRYVNNKHNVIIIISNLSNDRSKASCKTVPPQSAI